MLKNVCLTLFLSTSVCINLLSMENASSRKGFKKKHPILYKAMKYSGVIITSVIITYMLLSGKKNKTNQENNEPVNVDASYIDRKTGDLIWYKTRPKMD